MSGFFVNMSTRRKLFFSFGSLFLCILAMMVTAWSWFSELKNNTEMEAGPINLTIALAKISTGVDAIHLAMVSAAQNNAKDSSLWEINDEAAKISTILDSLSGKHKATFSVDEISTAFDAYKSSIQQTFVPLIKDNRLADATQFLNGPGSGQFKKLRQICKKDYELSETQLQQRSIETQQKAQLIIAIFGGIGLLSLTLVWRLSQTLNRVIAEPLLQITAATQRLAAGDLNVTLPNSDRTDEVGSLIRAFDDVIKSLGGMSSAAKKVAEGDLTVQVVPRSESDVLGSAFKSMVENMATATGQIKNAVSVLSSAVNNIMASVAESATGATETATAVTETTTTVEEVRQTSHIANQKAKNVAESAQKSAQISNMGRKSTEETIQGMKRIREQMDLIADSMVRLSEKSQSIVEIIATVDDLAQQSNLLAVNASIEAAKAGELGRGFAVVAQEVKTMADQSKQATAQVRKILTEIQQATSSAAMATELGSRAVDSAVTQSNQAGEAITVLANSVIESANAAAQIAVSSQQQLAGVDQVATAMMGIKEATAQNLVAIRHVEESAQSLQELGGMLKVILQRYHL